VEKEDIKKSEEELQKELEENIKKFSDAMDNEQARLRQKASDINQLGCGCGTVIIRIITVIAILIFVSLF
jgi:type IV secretory pathway component VirB8